MSQEPRSAASLIARRLLPAIVGLYIVWGVLYAVYTPPWQAPDEPAHYNYIRYLAEQHRYPVLKPGDYPAGYLDTIKSARFPPEMSIAPIRYEYHQPPLYYLLAVPLYQLFDGALLPLRLLSVLMGAVVVLLAYWIVRALWPVPLPGSGSPAPGHWLALGTAAFVAFLPMHVAVTAAVTNDPLAELLLSVVLLLSIRYVRLPAGRPAEARALVVLGVALGLGLLTKSAAYVGVPVALLAVVARHAWPGRPGVPRTAGALIRAAALCLLPAAALALPWWLRNIAQYGGLDFLGLGRHEEVVAGQLRMAEYVAAHGWASWLDLVVPGTFRSFWAQFGWMSVLVDSRLYQGLAMLSALAIAGLAAWGWRAWRRRAGGRALLVTTSPETVPGAACPPRPPLVEQLPAGLLLAAAGLLTAASYVWYNTQFVQFQGRYLFPATAALGLAAALGWREALRRERAWLMAGLLVAGAALLAVAGVLRHDLPGWSLLLLLAAAAALAVRARLPRHWDPAVQAAPYLLLAALGPVCLFLYIVPQLAP